MPSQTENIGLLIYSTSEYLTLFRDFWQSVNGTNQSGFQKIDAAYESLNSRVDTIESTIVSTFSDLLEEEF